LHTSVLQYKAFLSILKKDFGERKICMIKEEKTEKIIISLFASFPHNIFHLSELGDEMQIDQGENHN
jgi:hypothetical protein